ncbi:GntR family transcriptional regulator [soil metagenome]
MLVVIDANSGVPIYRQIVEQVRFQVATGLLRAGDELPSTRVLSQELGVNPMTVSKAWGLLEEEDVIARRPGLPLVVREDAPVLAVAARAAHLKSLLEAPASAAGQLGIPEEEAMEMFRQALAAAARQEEQTV